MTYEALIKAGQHQVRNDPHLMTAYIRIFKEKFGYEPSCAGCTFNSDWQKFANRYSPVANFKSQTSNQKQMEKSFKLFDELKIYTYRKTLENGIEAPVRTYGYAMTDEFAQNYLTIGTEEQIEQRKKEFKTLPPFESQEETINLSKMPLNQLKTYATEMGYPQEDWGKFKKKEEFLAYLEANSHPIVKE